MRTRKLLEVLAFLVTLGAAYALWFVPMNIVQELLTLAVGGWLIRKKSRKPTPYDRLDEEWHGEAFPKRKHIQNK